MRCTRARAAGKQAKQERSALRYTRSPITITRIPVILHTRIIGCHPYLPVSRHGVPIPALEGGSHAPVWSRRISLRLASYQKFICLPTNSSKSIDSFSEAPTSLEEIYLPAVYSELLLILLLSTVCSAEWPPKANSANDSNPTFIVAISMASIARH